MPPLVIAKQPIGKRNYFDCFESTIGGVIAERIAKPEAVLSLFSLPDAFALVQTEDKKAELLCRCFDVNSSILGFYNLAVEEFTEFEEFIKKRKSDESFFLVYDEFYVLENNNYNKTSFIHASVGKEILSSNSFKVSDPQLIVENNYGYDDRIINFQSPAGSKIECSYYLVKDIQGSENNFNDFVSGMEKFNADNWKGKQEISGLFTGIEAAKKYKELLTEKIFIKDFYKWIFPLVWKREYLIKNEETTIIKSLDEIIREMEVFETNLLRINSVFSDRLYQKALSRFDLIIDLLGVYIELNNRRVYGK